MKANPLPSLETLREYFSYCPYSGLLRTNKRLAQRVPTNTVVGSLSTEGYLKVTFKGKSYAVHRIAWKLSYGVDPEIVDHINWVKTDNRLCNLRSVSHTQNSVNRKSAKGYTKLPNGTLRCSFRGKDIAYVKTEEEAIVAYQTARENFLSL